MKKEFRITVLSGVSAGDVFSYSLDPDQTVTIGREAGCELMLQDPMVSRNHARISYTPEGLFLSDLGSKHGSIHMGFPLRAGEDGRRWLQNGDEFKIGGAIFRIAYEEEKKPAAAAPKDDKTRGTHRSLKTKLASMDRKTRLRAFAIIALVPVLLWLLLSGDSAPSMSPQASHIALVPPQERVLGNLPLAPPPLGDKQHVDKAQFVLPASDLVIEFDYLSETPIEVLVDETLVERLPTQQDGWRNHVLLYRDAKLGVERKLIFDNPTYPSKTGAPSKRWAVRNVRTSPVSLALESKTDASISGAITLVDRLNKTSDSQFLFLRALQTVALEYLREMSLDAVGYDISLDSSLPNFEIMRGRLDAIRSERATNITAESRSKHLQELLLLTAPFDAEIWRRSNLGLSKAKSAAERKDNIEAHDVLLSIKALFPDDTDFRYTLAERMFMDNKIVPAKVRTDPERYRRRK